MTRDRIVVEAVPLLDEAGTAGLPMRQLGDVRPLTTGWYLSAPDPNSMLTSPRRHR